jgi:hypothetical protein
MLSSSTNKYIQKADEVTGVSVSMRSWKKKSKNKMTSPVFLAHREVYHFCMKKGRRKPQASLPAIMTVIRLLRCASESASYQFAYNRL